MMNLTTTAGSAEKITRTVPKKKRKIKHLIITSIGRGYI
jgi:hypothetical protein